MSECAAYVGDVRAVLPALAAGSVRCCVTSPPYWGLRDYGVPGQLGLERTPEEYVARMVEVFREVRRVLTDDGTLWLNLGDSYAGSWGANGRGPGTNAARPDLEMKYGTDAPNRNVAGFKPKDLIGIPWRVAFALQADGWYLRSDIIWAKPNPMPESVTDRPTKSHEYLFLLSKSARYYYNADAIAEPIAESQVGRIREDVVGGISHAERGQHSRGGTYKQDRAGWTPIRGIQRALDRLRGVHPPRPQRPHGLDDHHAALPRGPFRHDAGGAGAPLHPRRLLAWGCRARPLRRVRHHGGRGHRERAVGGVCGLQPRLCPARRATGRADVLAGGGSCRGLSAPAVAGRWWTPRRAGTITTPMTPPAAPAPKRGATRTTTGCGSGRMRDPIPVLDLFSGYGGFALAFESIVADAGRERHGRDQDPGGVGCVDGGHEGPPREREWPRAESEHRGPAFRTIGFAEIEPYACALPAERFPHIPNFGDVATITRDAVLARCGVLPVVVTGGFPCQPHSTAGKRGASADVLGLTDAE